MLLIADIRNNRERVIQGLTKRHFKDAVHIVDQLISLDDQRKSTQTALDGFQAEANALAKQIGGLLKQGKIAEAEEAKTQTATLKEKVKSLGDELAKLENDIRLQLYNLPNIPHASVPEGFSAENNQVIFQSEQLPELHLNAKPHWELIKEYDIIDFELGVKITGAGFPVYKNAGARIQRAMINFFLEEAISAGYAEIQPPIVINEASGYGTGQLPDKEGQMYHATEDNLYLIPTAEVPLTNIYRDVILEESILPIKNVGYTPCFRREAGSWGAHVRGLNRLHQFDKVEIVQIQHPDNSYQALQEMCDHVEGLLKKLELPYRILRLCAGDMGFTSALTYDFEVYSAAQKMWLECSSVSNFETFQSNRLKLRYRDSENKKNLLHTLNGSALALPRILAALLENNQTPEGILIPKALQPYMGYGMIKKM